jgi:hypothetical protein
MRILIYTTHRTGSTSLANFLMFNYSCDYQRHNYFNSVRNNIPNDIIIKLTPNEEIYNEISNYFDKRIVLIREDVKSQAESRVFSDVFGKKFSSYNISDSFLSEYENQILKMQSIIKLENNELSSYSNCLHITYEELYKSNSGILKLEKYFDTKFKYGLEYKRYRNMSQSLL